MAKSHPFRQYTVLPCSHSFEIHSKISKFVGNAVLRGSPMFSLVSSLTVVFGRGFGGRILLENNVAGRLKPLDVERETKPGKYADGDATGSILS